MLKTASRRTTQTTTEAAEGLIGNKIANRITENSKSAANSLV